jgi:hypothetical protein
MPMSGAAGGFPGSLKPFASPGGWHSDVNHYKIRGRCRGPARELDGVASLTHHLEARAFEQTGHPLTEQQLVFCQVDAHRRWFRLVSPSTVSLGPSEPADESIVMVIIIGQLPEVSPPRRSSEQVQIRETKSLTGERQSA